MWFMKAANPSLGLLYGITVLFYTRIVVMEFIVLVYPQVTVVLEYPPMRIL